MKQFKLLRVVCLLFCCLSSCIDNFLQEVDISKIENAKSLLVLNSNPTVGDIYHVIVQRTNVIYSEMDTSTKVDDAMVYIVHNQDTVQLKPVASDSLKNNVEFSTLLAEQEPSLFVDSNHFFQSGEKYSIIVKRLTQEASATLVMDKLSPTFECSIDTIAVDMIGGSQYYRYVLNFSIVQQDALKYYLIKVQNGWVNNLDFGYYNQYLYDMKDINKEYLYNDFTYPSRILEGNSNNGLVKISYFTAPSRGGHRDDYRIIVMAIDKSYYDFILKARLNIMAMEDIFSEPVQIPSNVLNGLGNVSSVAATIKVQ